MAELSRSVTRGQVPEADLSTAARLLRQRTAASHRRVEQQLDLLGEVSPARMLDVLELLAGFWAGQEPALDAWFARHPDTAAALQWSRRSRSALLIDDLGTVATACGVAVPAVVPAPTVFPEPDEAEVLGWLYVAEGSTLGGAVIDRSLERSGFPCRLTHVAPYPEGPQPMWRSYLAHLEAWTSGEPARVDRVVAAGEATFAALEVRTAAVSEAAA